MAWRVEVKGGKALEKALATAGKRSGDAMGYALSIEAESIMTASKKELSVSRSGISGLGAGGSFVSSPSGGVDTGALRATGNVQSPKRGAGSVSVSMGFGGPSAPYALYLHEGTGPAVGRPPFHPPAEAFKDWARRVLGDESAAYAVAVSVGRKGLQPRKFLERPFRAAYRGMSARLAKRVRAYMNWQG